MPLRGCPPRGTLPDMLVRRANAGDAAAIQRLYELLVPGDANIQVDPRRLEHLEGDMHNHLLVVEADGSVCGTAFLTLCLDAMYGSQPYAVVENLIVLPPFRGRGLGRALMHEVERVARAAKCTKVMLLSTASRSEAHAFFASVGFDGGRKRGFVKYLNRAP
jgi:N-acetylglutamate synthase-like GNAT family acetyltransferase